MKFLLNILKKVILMLFNYIVVLFYFVLYNVVNKIWVVDLLIIEILFNIVKSCLV